MAALAAALPASALAQDRLVVLDRAAGEAVLVDPGTRAVLARLPTGRAPTEVTVSPDGRFAYVSSAGGAPAGGLPVAEAASTGDGDTDTGARPASAGAEAGAPPARGARGTVTVLDLQSRTVRATFEPGAYRGLRGIGLNRTGRRLWITAEADSGVLELDARDGTLLMMWKTGGARGRSLAVSPDGRKLYVANAGSDSVTVIDRLTVAAQRIPTGAGPTGLALSPSGRELWVANRADHTVTVLDTYHHAPLLTLPSGGAEPVRVRFRPDGREVWIAHRGSHTLSVFETGCRHRIAEVRLPGAPGDLLFSPDGRRAYVSLPERGEVAVLDVATRALLEPIVTGASAGLAWARLPAAPAAGAR